jgi:N-acetylmuramoyl-L-alanine amidase
LQEKANLKNSITILKNSRLLDRVVHQAVNGKSVLKLITKSNYEIKQSFVLENPFRLVFDLRESKEEKGIPKPLIPEKDIKNPPQKKDASDSQDRVEEPPTQTPTTNKSTLIETICIDPGHGGSDQGAIGNLKTEEKVLTLKISKKLKQLIISRLGLEVIMTREEDTEVSLNSRVSKANNLKAQMFVSVHVNSSYRRSAWGSETFYVSLKATDQEALLLSQRENESFEELEKIANDDELKMILWDMAQNEYIKESSILAEYIQNELNVLLKTRNRGVKQAPFRVLMRAAMPAVLVEVAFLSNPSEERKLRDDAFLDRVADAIYLGISKYIYYHNSMHR